MRIHLIAIGGAAMHNIALALHKNGHTVTGSDDEIYEPSRSRLQNAGLLPDSFGWDEDRIDKFIDAVILGMHAKVDNPELIKAQELGIEIYSYPEFIALQSKNKKRIVIGGSHGKTTTTSMILHVLKSQEIAFDYLVGAQLEGFDHMAQLSDAPIIVIEGDEYLSSPIDRKPKFLHYHPEIAVITGIAWDHINVFPSFDEYKNQFSLFAKSISTDGVLFYYNTVLIEEAASSFLGKKQGYSGFYQNERGEVSFGDKGVSLQIFGAHNMQNLEAAYLVCAELGIDDRSFLEAMTTFRGAAKRLQLLHSNESTDIFLDFAHAPSKVKATTAAVKSRFPSRPLVACLELHTFSSLNQDFLPEYNHSLNAADIAVVFYDEHTLKMKNRPDIDPELILKAFQHPNLKVIKEKAEMHQYINTLESKGNTLLFMSSGTFGAFDLKVYFSHKE